MKRQCKFFLPMALFAVGAFTMGCASTQAGKLSPEDKQVQFVIEFPGASKADLYRASNEWMVGYFVSAESVIQYQDRDEGIITGKGRGRFNIGGIGKAAVEFIITIEVKDAKVRLTLKDFFFYEIAKDPLMSGFAYPTEKNMPAIREWSQGVAWDYEAGVGPLLDKSW